MSLPREESEPADAITTLPNAVTSVSRANLQSSITNARERATQLDNSLIACKSAECCTEQIH
jgi:hypothetical protein